MSNPEVSVRKDLVYECRGLIIDVDFQALYMDKDTFKGLENGKPLFSYNADPPFRTRTIWQNLIKIIYPWISGFRVTGPIYYHKFRGVKNRQRIMIRVLVVDDNVADYQSLRIPPS
jgi:hypothetical protein